MISPKTLVDYKKALFSFYNVAVTNSQAWLRPLPSMSNTLKITVMKSVRDVDENISRPYQEDYLYQSNDLIPLGLSPVSLFPRCIQKDISKSGLKTAYFYNSLPIGGAKKTLLETAGSYIEILDNSPNGKNIRIDTTAIHGNIIGDAWFGGCSWSPSESHILYVAQTKKQKLKGLLENSEFEVSTKYDYVEDWGEKYSDINSLGLFILDTLSGEVTEIKGIDYESWTVGQPIFVPHPLSGKFSLAFTAWSNQPRKLGMIYCYQRKSQVFLLQLDETLTPLSGPVNISEGLALSRSPRVSLDGNRLAFLGSQKGFLSHGGCSELFLFNLSDYFSKATTKYEVLIPSVDLPTFQGESISFPGIFSDQLPKQCFIGENIVFSTLWGSQEVLVSFSLTENKLEKITLPISLENPSIQILDIYENSIVANISNYRSPNQLIVFDFQKNHIDSVYYGTNPSLPLTTNLTLNTLIPQGTPFNGIKGKIFQHETDKIPFQSILLYPTDIDPTKSLPLIVVPHGGPHSCMSTAYIASYAFLSSFLKVAVVHVNYRGSTGFGQASINSLLGNIGKNDVADLLTVVNNLKHKTWKDIDSEISNNDISFIDYEKIGIVGGSHGGFLGAHMCGQYPDIFKISCLRNPVTNIPAMVNVSDIPDWCFVESISDITDLYNNIASDSDLIKMRQCSPIAHIDNYKSPTLICLGAKDRRVPASQGLDFYHALKKRGVNTK